MLKRVRFFGFCFVLSGLILEPALGFDFNYECRIVATPSTQDQVAILPTGASTFIAGDKFFVEFWATDSGSVNTGIVSVYADLDYPESMVTCEPPIVHIVPFTLLPSGTCDGMIIDELGGSQLDPGFGIAPEWTRIAYVEFTSLSDMVGQAEFMLLPAFTESSAHGRGLISTLDINYGSSCMVTIKSPCECIYDLDDNCNIAGGDLGLFAPCWSLSDTDPGWNTNNCGDKDFDCNSFVSGGDLGWFASGWNRGCNSMNATTNNPPCRRCTDGPIICPTAAPGRSGNADPTASLKIDTQASPAESSVLLSLRLLRPNDRVHTPSHIGHARLGLVKAGEHVFAEVWAKDTNLSTDGLTVVFTDVHYNPLQFAVVSVDSGETFTLFSEPNVEEDNGVVRRVGGATLEPAHGAGTWTQVAVVELKALENVFRPVVSLLPSQGEAVSRYGRGLVPTDQVSVIPNLLKKSKNRRSGLRH